MPNVYLIVRYGWRILHLLFNAKCIMSNAIESKLNLMKVI